MDKLTKGLKILIVVLQFAVLISLMVANFNYDYEGFMRLAVFIIAVNSMFNIK